MFQACSWTALLHLAVSGRAARVAGGDEALISGEAQAKPVSSQLVCHECMRLACARGHRGLPRKTDKIAIAIVIAIDIAIAIVIVP